MALLLPFSFYLKSDVSVRFCMPARAKVRRVGTAFVLYCTFKQFTIQCDDVTFFIIIFCLRSIRRTRRTSQSTPYCTRYYQGRYYSEYQVRSTW